MTVLVIDAGSSSVRALLFDENARVVPGSMVRREHSFSTIPAGAATYDAVHLRELIEACVDEVLKKNTIQEIDAVGMDTFVGNLLGLDDNGAPVTPGYTYADTRSASDVNDLRSAIDIEATHQRTGCPHHTAYHPARLNWLRRTDPDLFQSVAQWADLGTYCYQVWFGREVPCSTSVASWSGLLNREALNWDETWLNDLDISSDQFMRPADFSETQQGLSSEYASRWPVLRDAPFYLAIGDGAAANVGSGAFARGAVALTVGTTAALRKVTDETLPSVPDGLWGYRVDAARHLIGGATTEGGNIFEWALNTFNIDLKAAEIEVSQRAADTHGLTFLPLLAGERSPGYATNATGAVHGLRLSTTPVDIVQAAMEGVALRLRIIADRLVDTGAEVYAGGGAVEASTVWAQMIADALNRPLNVLDEPAETGRGVALLVLEALHGRNITPPRVKEVLHPRPDHAQALSAALARHEQLYTQVVDV